MELSNASIFGKLNRVHFIYPHPAPVDVINDWWSRLLIMKSHFHCYNRPETALARCAITLIPPDSLDFFYDIVANDTTEEYINQIPALFAFAWRHCARLRKLKRLWWMRPQRTGEAGRNKANRLFLLAHRTAK